MNRSTALLRLSLAALAIGILSSASCAAPRNPAAPGIAAPSAHVTGTIVTQGGKPVAGAMVIYRHADLTTRKADPAQTAKTDAKGRFDIAPLSPSARQASTLYASSSEGVAVSSSGTTPTTLTLSPFTQVTLRFVDAQGKPVAGVSVIPFVFTLGNKLEAAWSGDISNVWTGTTAANGDVTLSHLPQGYTMMVAVADKRYANQENPIPLAKSPETPSQTIHLALGGALGGAVRYRPTGKPAADIAVVARQVGGVNGESVRTDSLGRYRLARLVPAKYTVQTFLTGDEGFDATPQAAVAKVTAGEQAVGPDFSLLPGALITGTITNKADGKPLAGVGVTVFQTGSQNRMTHETGKDGRYHWRLKPGTWSIYANSLGTQDMPPQKVNLAKGDARTINFKMTTSGGS